MCGHACIVRYMPIYKSSISKGNKCGETDRQTGVWKTYLAAESFQNPISDVANPTIQFHYMQISKYYRYSFL